MSKGILVALFCLWFSAGVQAAVQYPPNKNPFAKLEKAVAKMSKKEKAKLLETVYDFMIKREAFQTTPLVVMGKEPMPDWLNNLFWETADAVPPSSAQTRDCLSHSYAWTTCPKDSPDCRPTKYPNSCLMAGNIICTKNVPPKCNKKHLEEQRQDLLCDDGSIKCNPDLIHQCNGEQKSGDNCVNPRDSRVKISDSRKGPKITEACVTDYGTKSITDKAKEVAQCADSAKVADALKNIARFCSTLGSEVVDAKLREKNLFDSSAPRRDQRGHFRADWAGNDQDCLDMLNYIAEVQGNKPTRVATPTPTPAAPPKPADRDIACQEFPSLCEAQDTGATCGSYEYTPGNKQRDECIPVTITQQHTDYNQTPKICNDSVKDVSKEGRERQLGWIHRTCQGFNWNDRTKIGRGNIEDITEGDGYVCWDAAEGKFVRPDHWDRFFAQTVKSPAQKQKIKDMFAECANRANRELAKQGIVLRGATKEQVKASFGRVKSMWAIMRVDDVTNTHMSVKRTTGIGATGNGESIPTCSPAAPCTEGTFVCAQVDKKDDGRMEIKNDRVAEYVTIYADRQPDGPNGPQGVGTTQYVEVGTYRRPDLQANGTWPSDRNGDLGKKWKYEDCAQNFDVYDAEEDFPFIRTSKEKRPQTLRNEWVNGLFKKRQSVVYHATEQICPEGAIDAGRRINKVVARRDAAGQIDSGVYVCDSENGRDFARWMWTDELPDEDKNDNGTSSMGKLNMFNKTTGSIDKLNLTYNTNSVGLCLWRWSDTNQPAHLIPNDRTARVQGSIQNNSRSLPGTRGINSTEPPIVVEEPKK